jgi:hypothetical protein
MAPLVAAAVNIVDDASLLVDDFLDEVEGLAAPLASPVILGACPFEQWCAWGAPACQISPFHRHFHFVPHSSQWGASPAPVSSREPKGALTVSSICLDRAHLALGRWPIPFGGLERKDRAVPPLTVRPG